MRLLFIADGQSPIAQSWISYFIEGDYEVHLLSTSDVRNATGLASVSRVSVAFSGYRTALASSSSSTQTDRAPHAGPGGMRLR